MPWESFLQSNQPATDPATMLVNLGLVLMLGQLLAWHYLRFSPVLSNKRKFSRVFVFVSATTMLMISVVQTSLALSLGLVGALSIIRFRTPIKEPEELAYLFLAIGVGLGLGANQRFVTLAAFCVILAYMALVSVGRTRALPPRLLVHMSGSLGTNGNGRGNGQNAETVLRDVLRRAEEGAARVDLRRVDSEGEAFNATLVLDLDRTEEVGPLITRLEQALPGCSISVVEGNALE